MTTPDRSKPKPTNEDDEGSRQIELQEGLDYYIENGLFVFTPEFLLKRGFCCESGCRHCPYPHQAEE